MLLFICHVSEDKAGFVAPLAEALRKEYDVWYDDYELRLGDSLLEKIDDGLKRCDFGVVVLSKAFFAKKKWGRRELDGLFALEITRGKIILPVWKDITFDEVAEYSPMLAAKVAVQTAEGLSRVLEEIRLAVNCSERKRELTVIDAATQRVKAFEQNLAEKQRAEQLARSEQGAGLVFESIKQLYQTVESVLSGVAAMSSVLKFNFSRPMEHVMYVSTVHAMWFGLGATNLYTNSVANTRLEVKIFKRHFGAFGEPTSDLAPVNDSEFKPSFRSGDQVIWIEDATKSIYGTPELAAHLVDRFIDQVEEQMDENSA